MHKTERWVLFPYLAMDYKAAEDWLNQQARAGWRVASFDLRGWTVYLLPADRPDIRYCVDLSGEKARNQESYLALCHEAGWGLVETVRSMNVFCTGSSGSTSGRAGCSFSSCCCSLPCC